MNLLKTSNSTIIVIQFLHKTQIEINSLNDQSKIKSSYNNNLKRKYSND